MRGIVGFLTGLLAGIAICVVVFILLSIIFRMPGDAPIASNDPVVADAVPETASTSVAPADGAASQEATPQTPDATIATTAPRAGQLLAFERNSLPFNMPRNSRGLALVLVVPDGLDISSLQGQPLTIAIDPMTQFEEIGAYRAMGFEILTALAGETRNSVPQLSQTIRSMTGSVGVLDKEAASEPAANFTLLALLGEHGLAYITQTGFGGILGQAGEAGLPAIAVSTRINTDGDATNARLALDGVAQDVMQRGNQVVVVQMDAAMVPVMLSWIDAPKPRGMVLAPVSAVLRNPQ